MNHCRESHVFHNKAEMMCKCAKGNPQKLNVKTKNNLKSNDFSPTSTFHSDDVLGPFLKIYLGPLNYNIHPWSRPWCICKSSVWIIWYLGGNSCEEVYLYKSINNNQKLYVTWKLSKNQSTELCQVNVWKRARLGVWKQSRNNAKDKNMLNSLAAVIHENKRNADGTSEIVVNLWHREIWNRLWFWKEFADWFNRFAFAETNNLCA